MKLIALIVLAGACNTCNTGKPDSGKPDIPSPVTSQQDTIHLKLNSSFTVELGTTMGTGFRWSLADTLYREVLTFDSTRVLNDVQGKDNAPDTQVFYFTGIKKGKTKLHFIHARPWEKDIPPDKEKTFTVFIE